MQREALSLFLLTALASACVSAPPVPARPVLPSLAYSEWARQQAASRQIAYQRSAAAEYARDSRINSAAQAQLRMVRDSLEAPISIPAMQEDSDMVTNEGLPADIEIQRSARPLVRDYNGPLSLGDPGLSASLYRESRRGNNIFRDQRAYQPMDLITIVISENAEGNKEGDTEVKAKSSAKAVINEWLGIINSIQKRNPQIGSDGTLIDASTTNDFKGEGQTTRKDMLKATISAMVVEVLPGDILRIEGEKIISLNQEEQTIVISGLVRPWDINSQNEVLSSKVANLRIDYFGRGTVGEAQYGGWFSRLMRVLWPF